MRLLDRYIFGQVLITCLGAIGFFTFVMVTANALKEYLAPLVSGQLSILAVIPLLGLLIPYVIVYTVPMGMLCGILLVLGRMSAESETTAMRAAGLSLTRIAVPIYVLALVGVAGAVAVNVYYMPVARTKQKQELAKILRGDPLKIIQPKTFVRDFRNCVVYVHDKDGGHLRDVWIWFLDSQQRAKRIIRAQEGVLTLREEDDTLVVTLNDAVAEERPEKAPEDFRESPHMIVVGTTSYEFPLSALFGGTTLRRKLEWFTWGELQRELVRAETQPDPNLNEKDQRRAAMKIRLTMQEKLATAFTVLSFALIAVPLGIKVSRRETSANLGVAVLLALAYYVMTIMIQWLDKAPHLRPDLLLWVPNVLFVIVALWLQRRAESA